MQLRCRGCTARQWLEDRTSKAVAGRLGLVKQQLEDWARLWLAEQVVSHLHEDKLGGTTGE